MRLKDIWLAALKAANGLPLTKDEQDAVEIIMKPDCRFEDLPITDVDSGPYRYKPKTPSN